MPDLTTPGTQESEGSESELSASQEWTMPETPSTVEVEEQPEIKHNQTSDPRQPWISNKAGDAILHNFDYVFLHGLGRLERGAKGRELGYLSMPNYVGWSNAQRVERQQALEKRLLDPAFQRELLQARKVIENKRTELDQELDRLNDEKNAINQQIQDGGATETQKYEAALDQIEFQRKASRKTYEDAVRSEQQKLIPGFGKEENQ